MLSEQKGHENFKMTNFLGWTGRTWDFFPMPLLSWEDIGPTFRALIRRFNVPLTVRWLLEVDIGVSKGTPGDHVPTDPDREDGSGWAEFLIQHGLGDVRMQVPDVQGSHGVAGSAGVHRSLAVRRRSTRRCMSDEARVVLNGKDEEESCGGPNGHVGPE